MCSEILLFLNYFLHMRFPHSASSMRCSLKNFIQFKVYFNFHFCYLTNIFNNLSFTRSFLSKGKAAMTTDGLQISLQDFHSFHKSSTRSRREITGLSNQWGSWSCCRWEMFKFCSVLQLSRFKTWDQYFAMEMVSRLPKTLSCWAHRRSHWGQEAMAPKCHI